MVEEQIEIEVLIPNRHLFLPSNKGEVGAEFEEKPLQFLQYGGLEISLAVRVLQAQEVEQVRIAELNSTPPVYTSSNRD